MVVKTKELPTEQMRIDLDALPAMLDTLPDGIPLIGTSEKIADEVTGDKPKTGGLIINYDTPKPFAVMFNIETGIKERTVYEDGLSLTQKYSKVHNKILAEKLEELGYDDTEILQEAFHYYRLRSFRTGYARLIPVEKADIEVPERE